jgi:hypothetical protein
MTKWVDDFGWVMVSWERWKSGRLEINQFSNLPPLQSSIHLSNKKTTFHRGKAVLLL